MNKIKLTKQEICYSRTGDVVAHEYNFTYGENVHKFFIDENNRVCYDLYKLNLPMNLAGMFKITKAAEENIDIANFLCTKQASCYQRVAQLEVYNKYFELAKQDIEQTEKYKELSKKPFLKEYNADVSLYIAGLHILHGQENPTFLTENYLYEYNKKTKEQISNICLQEKTEQEIAKELKIILDSIEQHPELLNKEMESLVKDLSIKVKEIEFEQEQLTIKDDEKFIGEDVIELDK